MFRLVQKLPWRTPVIAALHLLLGLGPAYDPVYSNFVYGFFIVPGMLLELQIGPRLWALAAAGLAGSQLSVLAMDQGMHFDAGFRALGYTTAFAVLWTTFRHAGLFAVFFVVSIFACNILGDIVVQNMYAIPYVIGYAAGLCWLGYEQLHNLYAELHILSLRRGNKLY